MCHPQRASTSVKHVSCKTNTINNKIASKRKQERESEKRKRNRKELSYHDKYGRAYSQNTHKKEKSDAESNDSSIVNCAC